MDEEYVRMSMYERDRVADERLALERQRSMNNTLAEIRADIGAVASSVAKIEGNDRRRVGLLIASLVAPLVTSLIILWVTVQVYPR